MILNVYPNYLKNIKELFEEMKELGILHDNAEDIFEMLKKLKIIFTLGGQLNLYKILYQNTQRILQKLKTIETSEIKKTI